MKNKLFITVLTLISFILPLTLFASDIWFVDPPADEYWHTPANWTGGSLPTAGSSVGITRTYESSPVRIETGEAVLVNGIALGEGIVPDKDYYASVRLAGAMTNSAYLNVGDKARGKLLVDGGRVVVGSSSGGNGDIRVGNDSADAQGTMLMSNGVSVTWGSIMVGVTNGASGSVSWTDSAAAVFGIARIGIGAGTQGSFHLDNTTLTLYENSSGAGTGDLRIGESGTGMVSQEGGTLKLYGFLTIGLESGACGVYTNAGGTVSIGSGLGNGSHLTVGASGCGEMQCRSGTVKMYNQSTLVIRGEAAGIGLLQGWGDFDIVSLAAPNYVHNNGLIVADGEGTPRDLNMTDFYKAENSIANGTEGTNGWYAVNKGRLRYPRAYISATSALERGQGDGPDEAENDLVNSIHLSFTDTTGTDYLRGELYATDREDIPAGLPSNSGYHVLGVWKLPMTTSFGTVSLRIRHDRRSVLSSDEIRLYRRNATGTWSVVGTTDGLSEAVSTSAPLAPIAADGYIGWFAVVSVRETGTIISIL
jgi:hypothetical protein